MTHRSPVVRAWARATTLGLVFSVVSCTAWAGKPEWAGKGKGKHEEESHAQNQQGGSVEIRIGGYFGDDQRRAAQDYYGTQQAQGKCPPGLAKKNNGCQPPGQAKKWSRGQPLPRDVVFYPVPRDISVRIGLPPAGYKYVRVANDILLIAIGTSMVVDAIEDLMR
ncbi:hypothetical protein [Rhodoferax mekongensis]|uniref:DUF1236 domain-containing protein n=1 Tax=Rhodoferax mekongensis TaxID=3068341 RepID=A0ABZ0AZQ4_9BURK|nr:hypothetical protein [Rhodoferax sp. TBRC 17307]NBX20975.1 DUF1236 domain-containing protein [Betaproteobacteria bacterium]WNO04204.1 hypothetical protein RAN89_15030 [Rhodoferax sp. TBRC 17307]